MICHDDESRERVRRHREARSGKGFETIERYTDLAGLRLPDSIPLKQWVFDDSHSPKYQKFKIDELPIVEKPLPPSGRLTSAMLQPRNALSPTVDAIKTKLTTTWDAAKTAVSGTVDAIKTKVSSTWDAVKSNVAGAVENVKSSISNGFNAAKSTVSNIFTSIRTTISSAINTARNAVTSAVSAIRGAFNFSWSLPHLKLPHLSISGSFSINPPSVPHFSISWYKKAMENGMILNGPTIFGQKGNTLLAGGEAGSEAVVGTQSLMEMIRNAVASMANNTTINYGGVNINVYQKENQDIRALADEIEYRINNNVMRRRAVTGA